MYSFESFDEFIETMYRGNEVILEYNEKQYSVTPRWHEHKITGFYINKIYEKVYEISSPTELANFAIEGFPFSQIFLKMKVVDRVI